VLKGNIQFNKEKSGKKVVSSKKAKDLIDHFNKILLTNENFEFPDLLGAAYEYLIKYFADSAGKKGGEFYTPSFVVRLLVQLIKPQAGMSVYDPTVGSGGMLIQSAQYVEEQGQDARSLKLAGQDNNGTVWAICKMNMILHNVLDADIEYGDTVEHPQHTQNGQLKSFDRILANPPFSQNYTREGIEFPSRFSYGYAPETGKKADLMFVQHMIASLKDNGKMAVVVPNGVLFRSGKEKIIRAKIVDANLIEAIIGLPQSLFYGTSIPACILVINKNKSDTLRHKIMFINADAEYGEGKAQNHLRPEDIQKIDTVYTKHIQEPKYSRVVELQEIKDNEYNLNIRRYVDNTPAPEPHDVTAHLVGGVPTSEIQAQQALYEIYGLDRSDFFVDARKGYGSFSDQITSKSDIKKHIESHSAMDRTIQSFHTAVQSWWDEASEDFENIKTGKALPEVRAELLESFTQKLLPLKLFSQFQVEGIFVNWWKTINYDLKTVASQGWSPSLIPNDYIRNAFFTEEMEALDALESTISDTESLLEEAMEEAEVTPDTDAEGNDKPYKASYVKKALENDVIDFLSDVEISGKATYSNYTKHLHLIDADSRKEVDSLIAHREKVSTLNSKLAKSKKELKEKTERLEDKIDAKKYGREGYLNRIDELVVLKEADKASADKESGKKSAQKSIDALVEKKEIIEELLKEIGNPITEDEARDLILKKHNDLIGHQLDRYLMREKQKLIALIEKLWDKYAVSKKKLEEDHEDVMNELNEFLVKLKYL
jgi:type I restriction enzyme M protein